MLLTVLMLVLAAVSYWAGFRAPVHPLQHQSKGGFVVLLVLAVFSGYFALRERASLAELEAFIDPVPDITDVSYVPSSGEVEGLSGFMAALPTSGEGGGQRLDEFARDRKTDYWLLTTSLPVDSVVSFYLAAGPNGGWTVTSDSSPWLFMERGPSRLMIFVSDRSPRDGSKVLYALSPGS